jgi:hypothetical protein
LDAAFLGYPVLHNASLCKDLGYYYENGDTKQLILDFGYEEDNDCIDKQLDNNSPMQELKNTLLKVIEHLEKDKSEKSIKLKEEIFQQMIEIL